MYEDDIKGNVLEMGCIVTQLDASWIPKECEGVCRESVLFAFEDAKDKEKFEREAQYIDKEKRYDRKEKKTPSWYRIIG